MPKGYQIEVSTKVKNTDGEDEKVATRKTYKGPVDMTEALTMFGEETAFSYLLKQWKLLKGNDLRAKLTDAVTGGDDSPRASDARFVELDDEDEVA